LKIRKEGLVFALLMPFKLFSAVVLEVNPEVVQPAISWAKSTE
jgi:hypothetical protein